MYPTHKQTRDVIDEFHNEGCDLTGTAKILWTIVIFMVAIALFIGAVIIM